MCDVWFRLESMTDDQFLFMVNVPSWELANRIATNLVEEGFVFYAWVD